MPMIVVIMMINMISNSFCTNAFPNGVTIIATTLEVFHACASLALISINSTERLHIFRLAET